MQKVFKYPLELKSEQRVEIPVGASYLHVDVQRGQICLWALVEDDAQCEMRLFLIAGTGHPVPENVTSMEHVGSVLTDNGAFVWHVFDITPGA